MSRRNTGNDPTLIYSRRTLSFCSCSTQGSGMLLEAVPAQWGAFSCFIHRNPGCRAAAQGGSVLRGNGQGSPGSGANVPAAQITSGSARNGAIGAGPHHVPGSSCCTHEQLSLDHLIFHKHTRFLILDLQDSAAGALSSGVSLKPELGWD